MPREKTTQKARGREGISATLARCAREPLDGNPNLDSFVRQIVTDFLLFAIFLARFIGNLGDREQCDSTRRPAPLGRGRGNAISFLGPDRNCQLIGPPWLRRHDRRTALHTLAWREKRRELQRRALDLTDERPGSVFFPAIHFRQFFRLGFNRPLS